MRGDILLALNIGSWMHTLAVGVLSVLSVHFIDQGSRLDPSRKIALCEKLSKNAKVFCFTLLGNEESMVTTLNSSCEI